MPNSALQIASDVSHDDARLMAKSVARAGRALGLRQAEVAEAIGVSAGQVSKMKDGAVGLSGKAFELSAYLIRVFRALDTITGGDAEANRAWMRNENTDLGGTPAELIKSAAGLVTVMTYLDAARAPV